MKYDNPGSAEDLPERAALVVIDVQKGLDEHEYWGERNNPGAEHNIARLLDAWRQYGWPVYYIQHRSTNPKSPLRPGYVGNEIKDEVKPQPGEPVLHKSVNSAFIGTDLEQRLHSANHNSLVLTGMMTDQCVSATARMAGNLGFNTFVVSDATATFDRYSPVTSRHYTAEEMHDMELASLGGEFAAIVDTGSLLRVIASRTAGEAAAAR
jgi:nicotinamidase-related amidase